MKADLQLLPDKTKQVADITKFLNDLQVRDLQTIAVQDFLIKLVELGDKAKRLKATEDR